MKIIFEKRYALVDFNKNIFRFFYIEMISLGYKNIQIKINDGKLGNAGRLIVKEFTDYKAANDFSKTKTDEKIKEGYVEIEKIMKALKQKGYKQKTNNCDNCGNAIDDAVYQKIDKWARGEGGWDKDSKLPIYKSVYCIACQEKQGIYKVKF